MTVTTELIDDMGRTLVSIPCIVDYATRELVDWLAGSCRTTLFRFIGAAERTDGKGWTIRYRTVVEDDWRVVSDTEWVEFERLPDETAAEFQAWALQELAVMLDMVRAESAAPLSEQRPRSKVGMLWSVLFRRRGQ